MNEINEVGYNFHTHQENKPAKNVTYEISNMFLEYKESEDKVHAKEEFIEICERNSLHKFQFIGYFFNNSLSEKPNDFEELINMIFGYFYKEEKLIDNKQLIEGINVCVAHLPDLIIDYPNARQYAILIVKRAVDHEVM